MRFLQSCSLEIYQRMCELMPGGVNSPVRACKSVGQSPMIADSAEKDRVIDVEGNAFIDYCGSWGALIHGHAHPVVVENVKKRLEKGSSFGISCAAEGQLAEAVVALIDAVEMVRFVSSGTEATMSAIRLARAATERHTIVKFDGNYHGHADCFLVKAGSGATELPASSSLGIPQDAVNDIVSLPYNDIDAAKKFLESHRVAAVILEPVAGNMGVVPAKKEFLQLLREETTKQEALLIFDEVITGFRLGLSGAQGIFGITPDLTCLGKIIGGGFPAAAFGGRKSLMEMLAPIGNVYQAGTLSGNPVAMEAGWQSLKLLQVSGFYEELERKTAVITGPVKEYLQLNDCHACLQEAGSMFTLFFGASKVENHEEALQLDVSRFSRFFRFMYSNGIYIPPSQFEAWFVSQAHKEQNLAYTRDKILEFLSQDSLG